MSRDLILAINPGTTTTRCALYAVTPDALVPVAEQNLDHEETMMAQFASIGAQLSYRAECVAEFLRAEMSGNDRLLACAGRGGMLTPVPAGVIAVNDAAG